MIDVLELTRDSPDLTVSDGDVIIRQGDRTNGLVVLVSGTVAVSRRGNIVTEMSNPGTIMGELGLLLDIPATADVIAVGECVVRRMTDAEATFADNPAFARHLATMLAARLLHVSSYLSDLQEQYADRDDTLGLVPAVLRDLLSGSAAPIDAGSEREPDSPY
jgi:CRP-like cAMP-binding protein